MKRVLTVFALVSAILTFANAPAAFAQDLDCIDFNSQEEAQAYFEAGGGSPSYNFNNLDADRDGYACENHFGYIGAPVSSQPDTGGTDTSVDVTELPATGTGTARDLTTMVASVTVILVGVAATAFRLRRA